jgi:glycosyltransferase involved in cell wall biosynthesis
VNVAYDARMAIGQFRGMGRFLRQLIAGYEREFLGFCASGEGDPSLNLIARGFRFFPLWEQVSIPSLVREFRTDLFVAPYNTGPLRLPKTVKLLLVVHDLIFLEDLPSSPSMYQNLGRAYRRVITPRILDRANAVLTVSNFSKERLVTRCGVSDHKICVIPNTLEDKWFQPSKNARDRKPYIFVVSGQAPSKNLAGALESFALYAKRFGDKAARLKVAGVDRSFHEIYRSLANRLGVGGQVELLEYLPDSEVLKLYQGAELFWFPSLMEGFGIPILEAMASGTPVLASASTSLPEVAGNAAIYVDPRSVTDMADALSSVMTDADLRQDMSAAGREQVAKFHPDVVKQRIRQLWISLGVGIC